MKRLLPQMVVNDEGALTFEWILLITLLVIGVVGGLSAARDAIITELGDVAGAAVNIDQSYTVSSCTCDGTAFGNGAHPTTCLVLRALDHFFSNTRYLECHGPLRGLDVGTGTGILAIALAKLGIQEVVGIDTDPCAVSEATYNVLINGLAEQVSISNTALEELVSHFSLIVANLAYPTLKRIAPSLSAGTEENGFLILSGFLESACKNLSKTYAEQGFRLVR